MKSPVKILVLCSLLVVSCAKMPQSIASGQWHYDLIVNGIKAGNAVMSTKEENGLYVSRTSMTISMGTITSTAVQVATETKDFKPVKLETCNTIEDSATGTRQEINKTADFNGSRVTLKSTDGTVTFTLDEPFIIEGNYFEDQMIRNKFRDKLEIRARIYEPMVEIDKTILVIVNVIGKETIKVNGRSINVFHYKERVEKLKSVDVYVNEEGVTVKISMKMLNNTFELVLVD